MTRESPIVRQIQLAATALGARLFRNGVGTAVWGSPTRMTRDGAVYLRDGDVVVPKGRIAQAGWTTGSSDLLGWREITITPEMVGRTFAQLVCVEVKRPGKSHTSPEQKNWLKVTTEAGACSGIVKSIAEAEELLRSKP